VPVPVFAPLPFALGSALTCAALCSERKSASACQTLSCAVMRGTADVRAELDFFVAIDTLWLLTHVFACAMALVSGETGLVFNALGKELELDDMLHNFFGMVEIMLAHIVHHFAGRYSNYLPLGENSFSVVFYVCQHLALHVTKRTVRHLAIHVLSTEGTAQFVCLGFVVVTIALFDGQHAGFCINKALDAQ
jgi:hypothetical protein